ncbi:SDR family oxidoreductase [Ferviditalea candida]|uniref:SDR family oxidoreductase n=1 Tax=Ferviditalea candida TaxID=3108399 RepID=A0ABU5ZHI6_9BACL|nr:SDR family oxidoreductase [Paenibacillaceae bacterium T2]
MSKGLRDFSLDVFSLKGKVAIVTGGNTNLGMGYAYAFAKAGADLFIPHFTDDVSEVKQLIEETGQKVHFLQGDLTNNDYIDEVVRKCMEVYGKIDILVNNAGAAIFGEFLEYPDKAWDKIIDINLNAVYYMSHRVVKEMVKQGSGKIINIASALSFTADKMCPPYTASKHAVVGVTRVFANEVGHYNIQTNALAPGFLYTDVNKEITSDKALYDKITNRIPAGRWGVSYDLLGTAVFLASSASDYVNGWTISVDGGFTTTL